MTSKHQQQILRWGVLSTAKIATEKVIPALQQSPLCEVTGIASRNKTRAQATAMQLGIPGVYDSYQALLEDDCIDAIYNPLPNHMHVEWSIRALQSGKHVLCEKPIGLSSEEGLRLQTAARAHPELKVAEAFMYRHHPQWLKATEIVTSGGIGKMKTIQSFFSYFNDDPSNIRNQPDIGGGALMDIGCYNISLSRLLFGSEPTRVMGLIERDPAFGTDRLSSAMMVFDRGTSTFTCSTQAAPFQRVNVLGTTGRVEIEIPFNAPPDASCVLWHQHGETLQRHEFQAVNQYTLQGESFARAVFEDTTVEPPLDDAVNNMIVIEAIQKSARDGRWVEF